VCICVCACVNAVCSNVHVGGECMCECGGDASVCYVCIFTYACGLCDMCIRCVSVCVVSVQSASQAERMCVLEETA
jgi:hypothetical protein